MEPEILSDGQVRVDMGVPVLNGASVPVTLAPTRDGMVVAQKLEVAGSEWTVTGVSMGNPHAVVFSRDGKPIKVKGMWPLHYGELLHTYVADVKRGKFSRPTAGPPDWGVSAVWLGSPHPLIALSNSYGTLPLHLACGLYSF